MSDARRPAQPSRSTTPPPPPPSAQGAATARGGGARPRQLDCSEAADGDVHALRAPAPAGAASRSPG